MTLFSGLSAFPVTPIDAKGAVMAEPFERIVSRLSLDGVCSIGVLGSTGAYVYLSLDERARALEIAIAASGSVPVLAGIGALTTREVILNANAAEKAGASGVLLAPVSYLPLTNDDVRGLVEDVTRNTSLPLCLYNNPGTTKFDFSEELIAELSKMPGVAAVKNPPAPAGDFAGQITRLRQTTSTGFSLGYSGDSKIAGALSAGCDAWYSVLGGTLPNIAIELWEARADVSRLSSLNANLAPLWKLFDTHGSIRVIYEIANVIGLGLVSLPAPLMPLDRDIRIAIEQALANLERNGQAAA